MFSKLRFGLLLLLVLIGGSISLSAPKISAEQILNLVNEDRAAVGLPALSFNQTLNSAALAKAQDMLKNNYFAHISPSGTKPWEFFRALGYNYAYAGENLALNYSDEYDLINSWMNSPKHRENILSPNYSDLGLAVVNNHGKTVIVQFFGSEDFKLTFNE